MTKKEIVVEMLAMMATFLVWFSFLFLLWGIEPAKAHVVDELCSVNGKKFPECQPEIPEIGLVAGSEYYFVWKAYWHERRTIVTETAELKACLAAVDVLAEFSGLPKPTENSRGVINFWAGYWEVVPALAVASFPKNIKHARGQLGAAIGTLWHPTIGIYPHLLGCQATRVIYRKTAGLE